MRFKTGEQEIHVRLSSSVGFLFALEYGNSCLYRFFLEALDKDLKQVVKQSTFIS